MPRIKKNNDLSMSMALADIKLVETVCINSKEAVPKYLKGQCAYHLQQAAEKLIKIQIYCSGVPINNAKIYKHSIIALLQYAQQLNVNINVPKAIISNAQTITDWEALGRYDLHIVVRTDTLKKYYTVISEWYDELYKAGYR